MEQLVLQERQVELVLLVVLVNKAWLDPLDYVVPLAK
jgi:hypothetical protein